MTTMKRYALLGTLLVSGALAGPANAATMTDQVLLWPTYGLTPNGRQDLFLYYTKQYWLSPAWGIFTFYNTSQSLTLRGMYKTALGESGVTGTVMAGWRFTGMGNNLVIPANNAPRQGPEVALVLAKSLWSGGSLSAMGSAARLWDWNTPGNEASMLYYYGASYNHQVTPTTTLSIGLLGAVHQFDTAGLKFHDLGPTLGVTQAF